MIKHIVLFQLKNKSDIAKGVAALKSMKGQIEGMIELEVGVDFLHSDRSYDIALVTTHNDRDCLESYQAHPVHQPVKKIMHAIREHSVSVDFEI